MNGLNEAYLHVVLADRQREAEEAYLRSEIRALRRADRRARADARPRRGLGAAVAFFRVARSVDR